MRPYDKVVVADSSRGGRHVADRNCRSMQRIDLLMVSDVFHGLANPTHELHEGLMSHLNLYLNVHGQQLVELWYADHGSRPREVLESHEILSVKLPEIMVTLHPYRLEPSRSPSNGATYFVRCGDGANWQGCWCEFSQTPLSAGTVYPIFAPGGGHPLVHGDEKTQKVVATTVAQLEARRAVLGAHHNCRAYGTGLPADQKEFHRQDSERIAQALRQVRPELEILPYFCPEEGGMTPYHSAIGAA